MTAYQNNGKKEVISLLKSVFFKQNNYDDRGQQISQKIGFAILGKVGHILGGFLKRHFSDLFLFLSTVQTIMTGTDKKKILWDLRVNFTLTQESRMNDNFFVQKTGFVVHLFFLKLKYKAVSFTALLKSVKCFTLCKSFFYSDFFCKLIKCTNCKKFFFIIEFFPCLF